MEAECIQQFKIMALLYFPTSSLISRRSAVSSSYEVLAIDAVPGAVFYFNSASAQGSHVIEATSSKTLIAEHSVNSIGAGSSSFSAGASQLNPGIPVPPLSNYQGEQGTITFSDDSFYIAHKKDTWKKINFDSWGGTVSLYDNLLAWWSIDNPDIRGEDISGNNHYMTSNGNPRIVPGIIDMAISGNSDGGFAISNTFFDPSTTSWTLGCWVCTGSVGPSNSVAFGGWGAEGEKEWNFYMINENWNIFSTFYNPLYTEITGAMHGSIESGGWHFVATTYDNINGIYTWYFDGSEVAESSPGVGPPIAIFGGESLSIGGTPSITPYFSGKVDECFIYTRELSPGEISQLYNSGAATHPGL